MKFLYKIKSKSIKYDFHQDKHEQIQSLIEQNRFLEQKLSKNYFYQKITSGFFLSEQLEYDLHYITEQNQQQYEKLNNEYHRLELQVSGFESSIQISRHNTVHLTSEINTYQCLLANLVQKPKPKPKSKPIDFTVHFGNGIIWCRI